MIPVGIFNQNTRDLSKEIWISWGYGYPQEEGVYVNALSYPPDGWSSYTLLNAAGGNSGLRLEAGSSEGGFIVHLGTVGVLDIINRNYAALHNEADGLVHGAIQIFELDHPRSVDVFILNAPSHSHLPLAVSGWGSSVNIPSPPAPNQSSMETSDDWHLISGQTSNIGYNPLFLRAGGNIGSEGQSLIRAIVIKLL